MTGVVRLVRAKPWYVATLALCLAIAVSTAFEARRYTATTTGVVVAIPRDECQVVVRYSVDGADYERRFSDEYSRRWRSSCDDDSEIGEERAVRYDPSDPAEATDGLPGFELMMLSGLAAVILAYLVVAGRRLRAAGDPT